MSDEKARKLNNTKANAMVVINLLQFLKPEREREREQVKYNTDTHVKRSRALCIENYINVVNYFCNLLPLLVLKA